MYAIKRQEQINESKQKDKIIELDDETGYFKLISKFYCNYLRKFFKCIVFLHIFV